MQLFVHSAGHAQEHEYAWRSSGGDGARGEPVLLSGSLARVLQPEGFSLVLGRSQKQLLLVVMGLPSGRNDFRGRSIRNALAIEADPEDEPVLRMVAAAALRGELGEGLASVVRDDPRAGVQVGWEALGQWIEGLGRARDAAPDRKRRIAADTPAHRHELCEELEAHALPEGEGALVVVTRALLGETLLGAGAWRGLSNLIPEESWEVLPEPENKGLSNAKKAMRMTAMLLFLIAAILGLMLLLT